MAICEYDGYIYNKDGIDVHALLEYEHKSGSICGFDGAETNEDSLKVRLLAPPPPQRRILERLTCDGVSVYPCAIGPRT